MKTTKKPSEKSATSSESTPAQKAEKEFNASYKAVKLCSVGCPMNGQMFDTADPLHISHFDCELCGDKGMNMTIQRLVDLFVAMSTMSPQAMYAHVAAAEEFIMQKRLNTIKEKYH